MNENTNATPIELTDLEDSNADVTGGFICGVKTSRLLASKPKLLTERAAMVRTVELTPHPRGLEWER